MGSDGKVTIRVKAPATYFVTNWISVPHIHLRVCSNDAGICFDIFFCEIFVFLKTFFFVFFLTFFRCFFLFLVIFVVFGIFLQKNGQL